MGENLTVVEMKVECALLLSTLGEGVSSSALPALTYCYVLPVYHFILHLFLVTKNALFTEI